MDLDHVTTLSDLAKAIKVLIPLNPSQKEGLIDDYTWARDEIEDGESETNEVHTAVCHIQEMVEDGLINLK